MMALDVGVLRRARLEVFEVSPYDLLDNKIESAIAVLANLAPPDWLRAELACYGVQIFQNRFGAWFLGPIRQQKLKSNTRSRCWNCPRTHQRRRTQANRICRSPRQRFSCRIKFRQYGPPRKVGDALIGMSRQLADKVPEIGNVVLLNHPVRQREKFRPPEGRNTVSDVFALAVHRLRRVSVLQAKRNAGCR
ncbi:hypothetical protein Q3O98_11395 [Ralstonia pseudosolanacearum]|uniref:hypothetical protein n=1 Tax=Ralstonia pseudosolanacearum TaxID=1310165 RepID=UPI0026751235|nr:hypothetical protein [Ralstonia pseudosolanacearum]MDO3621703.1 hypothetical protein [Ralstonia pseudosolanacearum]